MKTKLKLKFKQAQCRAATCRAPQRKAEDTREKAASKAAMQAQGPPGPRAPSFQENNGIPLKRRTYLRWDNLTHFLVGARNYMQS